MIEISPWALADVLFSVSDEMATTLPDVCWTPVATLPTVSFTVLVVVPIALPTVPTTAPVAPPSKPPPFDLPEAVDRELVMTFVSAVAISFACA